MRQARSMTTTRKLKAATVLALMAIMALSSAVHADSIQLRRSAVVSSDAVRLVDVAALEGEAANQLADIVVLRTGSAASLTQDSLKAVLTKAGVNWARISLKGFETCEIVREGEGTTSAKLPAKPVTDIDAPPAPVIANPTEPVAGDATSTVSQRLDEWLRRQHGEGSGDLRITFADREKKDLDLPVGQDTLVFTGGTGGSLGRVPVTIQRFKGDKLVSTSRCTVDIALRQLAVVATRSISKGATVSADDVEIRQVDLDRDPQKVLTRLDAAIGQVAATSLREGAVLNADTVRSALLVQRNDLIRIQAIAGGLVIQTVGRALEDGADGQVIQARNERSRDTFSVRVSGTRQAVLVADAVTSGDDSVKNPQNTKVKAQGEH